jgi:hypothetical protein
VATAADTAVVGLSFAKPLSYAALGHLGHN